MGLTTILSIFILQLGVSDKLPRSSDVVPLICKPAPASPSCTQARLIDCFHYPLLCGAN